MRYISLFSGIEAASCAWETLGWEPIAFSEIDPFPKAVLANRYPGVPDLGDITKIDWSQYAGSADIVVGGSPCQSFSIAGSRTGLKGASGLMWEYVRAVQTIRPEWFVWENVPGALSSSHGEDFRCLLASMDELGYGLAWRVLDAQFFGVAQRRRRVFLVGHLGDQRAAEVLFEREGLRWDTPSSREKREALTRGTSDRIGTAGKSISWNRTDGRYTYPGNPSLVQTLSAHMGTVGDNVPSVYCASDSGTNSAIGLDIAPTLTVHDSRSASYVSLPKTLKTDHNPAVYQIAGNIIGSKPENGGHQLGVVDPDEDGAFTLTSTARHAVAFAQNQRDEVRDLHDCAGALDAHPGIKQQTFVHVPSTLQIRSGNAGGGKGALVAEDMSATLTTCVQQTMFPGNGTARRLTPLECERLQGFPDGWTDIPYRGKPHAPDSARYKALGNSMAVPVMQWIGKRMEETDQ